MDFSRNKDYIQKLNAIEHSREAYEKGHNTPPGVPTQKGLTGDVEFISEAYLVVGISMSGKQYSRADAVGDGDPETFSQYNTNIIVGRIGIPSKDENGEYTYRFTTLGICVYGKNVKKGDEPNFWISKDSAIKILKNEK